MRIFLAGNRGYLGTVLSELLTREHHEVVGLDTGYFDAAPLQPRRDVRDAVVADLAGCDAVVNLAALCNDACGNLSGEVTTRINSGAATRLARLARAADVPIYVLASSCSVYGAAPDEELLTEGHPVAPQTAYALSKVTAERELLSLARDGFAPVVLRFATLFGDSPALRSDVVVNRIAGTAVRWGEIRVNGDGELWRPLLHVRDAARAVRDVLVADRAAVAGEVFNVGVPEQTHRIIEVVDRARELVPGVAVSHGPAVDGRSYRVDFTKFLNTIGSFRSSCSIAAGLGEVVRAYEGRLRLPLLAAGDGWAGTDRRERLVAMRSGGQLGPDFRWNVASLVVA